MSAVVWIVFGPLALAGFQYLSLWLVVRSLRRRYWWQGLLWGLLHYGGTFGVLAWWASRWSAEKQEWIVAALVYATVMIVPAVLYMAWGAGRTGKDASG